MKPARGAILRWVDQPDPQIRFYLFHGPDEAQSRALGARLRAGTGAEKFLVAAGSVKSDPALLADEAAAISMFGGKRLIWVEPAGDEIAEGVAALLEASAAESPVVAIAGGLRKTSALLKLAEAHSQSIAHASYAPEGREAERMVVELGQAEGLRIRGDVASRIADAAANDQGIVAQELAKLAIFLGASPDSPRELDHDALDAVGAEMNEGDFLRLADIAMAGDLNGLAAELDHLSPGGTEAIPVIRALQRRLLMLAPIRARADGGERPDAVMASAGKSLFWKDKKLVEQLLRRWDSASLATVADRAGRLERELMRERAPGSRPPEAEMLGEELTAIARAGARRR